ncbi:MAG: ASKHA domain-containing protein [Verrucomicrobiota bacterium]|jgi:uncharacterized 2Fe-2S/4Fe-4S cluster protein (DUF4445 family)|nr:ASKHA domain-containing protein [Verrucomicrobiota bacterium]
MPTITFIRENTAVTVPPGATLLDAARRAGVTVDAPCNGAGTCGKCRVRLAAPGGGAPATVLACQTPVSGDAAVETLAHRDREGLEILADGRALDVAIDPPAPRRLGLPPGAPAFGAAVDIGTTTLVVSLVDLRTGAERAVASALNPQSRHAQDVLSRIKLGSTPEGLRLLQSELAATLNTLTAQAAAEAGVPLRHIHEAVLSGNTTMVHLAAGANPASLGKYPYTPVLQGGESLPADALGLDLAPGALVYLPPFMSAYVGADISSGILATRLAELRGVTLFVDIGTNGEMVLAADGALTATSTAAGPAFEGMNIACGMRASPGAIEQVTLAADGALAFKTIGGAPPAGLCGSGLLDAVGELAAHGAIDKNGRLQTASPAWAPRFETLDGKPVFRIAGPVHLSQKDVRQVQLAKAAVRAGIELMLAANGVPPAAVDRVLIAGSFGFHLRTASLLNLGLLPREFGNRVEFVGNTSKTGARALLLNGPLRDTLASLVRRVRVLELANDPAFEKTFVKSLAF